MPKAESPLEAPIVEAIKSNELFRRLAEPIPQGSFPVIRDAEFFIRRDGLIVNAEGWHHPGGNLVGEVLYAPDPQGDKSIFGQGYRKVTLYPGTFTPVPYARRAEVLRQYDPSLDQTKQNPFYARYKQILPQEDFIANLPSRRVLQKVLNGLTVPTDQIQLDLFDAQKLLELDFSTMQVGLTGGPLLGNINDFHDVDLVFQESLEENLRIAKSMRDLVKENPHRRLVEGGKGWNIRFYNDRGTLMCNFFSYRSPEEAALRDFEMDVLTEDVQIEATVTDDTHSIYTPTVLGITDVEVTMTDNQEIDVRTQENMKLIAYHTATRGECFAGDQVRVRGALVDVRTPTEEYRAICVIEREGIRNMTPTWEDYYDDSNLF